MQGDLYFTYKCNYRTDLEVQKYLHQPVQVGKIICTNRGKTNPSARYIKSWTRPRQCEELNVHHKTEHDLEYKTEVTDLPKNKSEHPKLLSMSKLAWSK